jgi:hypothetical protein
VEDGRDEAFAADAGAERGLVARGGLRGGAEVDREERRREVERLVPAADDLRGEVGPLRVAVGGAEHVVVVEVPALELGGRQPAERRVREAQRAVEAAAVAAEDDAVDHLVEQVEEREDDEADGDRGRDPGVPAVGPAQDDEDGRGEDDRLAEHDEGVAEARDLVEGLEPLGVERRRHGGARCWLDSA